MGKKLVSNTSPALNADNTNDIIDIDLSPIKKKRFRINGDNDLILELNTSDMTIMARIDEAYPKLMELQQDISKMATPLENEDDSQEVLSSFASILKETDDKMRELVDYIFNANVSDICARDGSMYDPIEGTFRFEHIITTLLNLYSENFELEFNKIKSRVNKYAKK